MPVSQAGELGPEKQVLLLCSHNGTDEFTAGTDGDNGVLLPRIPPGSLLCQFRNDSTRHAL